MVSVGRQATFLWLCVIVDPCLLLFLDRNGIRGPFIRWKKGLTVEAIGESTLRDDVMSLCAFRTDHQFVIHSTESTSEPHLLVEVLLHMLKNARNRTGQLI